MLPQIKKILYATDLSETARHAIWYAASLADKYQAEVSILHVIPDILEEYSQGAGFDLEERLSQTVIDEFNATGLSSAKERLLARLRETCEDATKEMPHCPFQTRNVFVEVGKPAEIITAMAETEGYDLVVMGTHGHGKLEELLIGSVAAKVIRRCSKPVLVVRLPK